MPVFFKLHRADVRQRRVQSGPVVPEQPGDDFIGGLAPAREALAVQPLHLQRAEHGFAAGVVPAVAGAAHRGGDAVLGQQCAEILARVLTAAVAVEDEARVRARTAFEPGHAQRVDDDRARHVLAQ